VPSPWVEDKPKFRLPLTPDEQVELLGVLLSANVKIKKLKELINELNTQLQSVILELEMEKKIKMKEKR
jgi:hypothetical protein